MDSCEFLNRMQVNPEKCQAIAIGQMSAKELDSFILNVNIPCENEVKLLGVTIDFKLNFNSNISNICKRHLNKTTKLPKAYREILNSPWQSHNLPFVYIIQL